MNQKVSVRVTQKNGVKTSVLEATERKVRKRFLNFLLGRKMNVLVVSPGDTVSSIEIIEHSEEEEQTDVRLY